MNFRAMMMGALAVVCHAQGSAIDAVARKDIDAGNRAWVDGMKAGAAAPIAATYAEKAVDCTADGECIHGRAAIETFFQARIAKSGRAMAASTQTMGSVQQGDFVYEWGRSEVAFPNGQRVAHRYLTVWQRQRDGGWRIFRNMPIPDDQK